MTFIEVVLNDEKAIKETNHRMHKSYFHLYSLLPPVALKLLTLECQQTAFFKQTPIFFSFLSDGALNLSSVVYAPANMLIRS